MKQSPADLLMKIIAAIFGVFFLWMSACGGFFLFSGEPFGSGVRILAFACVAIGVLGVWAMVREIVKRNKKKPPRG